MLLVKMEMRPPPNGGLTSCGTVLSVVRLSSGLMTWSLVFHWGLPSFPLSYTLSYIKVIKFGKRILEYVIITIPEDQEVNGPDFRAVICKLSLRILFLFIVFM